ncbi:Endonuclease YncB, thermonuclease family [Devosia enhydra]|uniref:Endonuclease YncB, thermonuclease family n=1 Tax=Devosia enhydra TaxID=665118 RepID=A0A1K2I044_9HYPH|nr:thermonuclease family protein [Devosia enhydra]SFZ85750.1 Endonuclease YncB, thermonuclease family [Devosia enhydra]
MQAGIFRAGSVRAVGFGMGALAMVLAFAGPAAACDALTAGPRGIVTSVVDGDTVQLGDGTQVRLIGTQAPKLPLGRDGFETWPLADEAKAALEALALGKPVQLRYGGERIDRHGRALAHLYVTDGTALSGEGLWAQGEMIAAGLARVYSFPDNRSCLAELMASETRARLARLGIWSDPYYSVRRADRPSELLARVGHYELVEGRVLAAERSGSRVFLNFGRLWKEDFTITIENRALRLFTEAGIDPLRLETALIRVRGWVDDRDGPRIEVTHPEQIEVLASP